MKILQVVTLVSADGAFGGPVSVARQQSEGLVAAGHEVTVAGLRRGAVVTSDQGSATWRLFPARTFVPRSGALGLGNLRLFAWLLVKGRGYDVVHVHAGRDLVSLVTLGCAVGRKRQRVVAQTHGMVIERSHLKARVFDIFLRPLLRRCAAILVLTTAESDQMRRQLGERATLVRLGNGISLSDPPGGRQPAADGPAPIVMFLARLHPRKRALAFAEAAALLRDQVDAEFQIFGPDEGSLTELLRFIAENKLESRVTYGGPVPSARVRPLLRTASVYVLPSVGEIFPVSLLEAMAEGVPSVTTDDSGIADLLARTQAAVVTDGSVEQLSQGILDLLSDPQRWVSVRQRGLDLVSTEFAADAVIARLLEVYGHRVAAPGNG